MKTENKRDGISLRTIHLWLIIGAVIISGLMFYSTFHLSKSFRHLAEASEKQIELRKVRHHLIANKIEEINRELEETSDGLPVASISVGIVHGSEANDPENLYQKTDEAMYQSKQRGKRTYTFYDSYNL